MLWKMRFSSAKIVPRPPYTPPGTIKSSRELRPSRAQLVKKVFDKLVDGRASSPATATPTSFCKKSFRFPGAKTARKRFLLWKMRFSSAKIVPRPPYTPPGTIKSSRELRPSRAQLVKKVFDKLVDGRASSPATATPTSFCKKSFRFPGAKTARKRFLLWKIRFSAAKIVPCPPYTPPGTIKSSRELRSSRTLQGFFDSLKPSPYAAVFLRLCGAGAR